MTTATTDDLLVYLADLVERLERFAVTLLPPDEADDEISLGKEKDGCLTIDLLGRFPLTPRSKDVDLELFERWSPEGRGVWERIEYRYELRHHEISYRRAFHRHDVDYFVRAYDVATHEHCESTLGLASCGHHLGEPVADAADAFTRLYELWVMDQKPDCSARTCLG